METNMDKEEQIDINILKEVCEESDEETANALKESAKSVKEHIKATSMVIHHNKQKNKNSGGAPLHQKIPWDPEVVELFNEKFPGVDIYKLSLKELQTLYHEVEALREEFSLVELAYKTLSNAAYGASSSPSFYFYNLELAKDITGECRNLTRFFWDNLPVFFHETIWERKDLWEKFGFELDESKHDLCRETAVACYSDTDSVTGDTELRLKLRNIPIISSFDYFYDYLINILKIQPITEPDGKQIIPVPDFIEVLNWTPEKGTYYAKMRYLMCHPVKKDLYKIETENGKKITATADHSVMVEDNKSTRSIKTGELKVGDRLFTF